MRWNRSWRNFSSRTRASRSRWVATSTRTFTRNGLVAADPFYFAFLQHAKQLGLHLQRHVADLVQKNRAVIRLLELADVPSATRR